MNLSLRRQYLFGEHHHTLSMAKIRDYEIFKIPPRWMLLKLETDDGVVGWGEPIVEGRADTVQTAVTELLEEYLLGEDPFQIEDNWQLMYRAGFYRGGPVLMSALGGIDQALWDIKGKYLDIPVFELLGGAARERIRAYQTIGSEDPEQLAELALEAQEQGYSAIKLYPTVRPDSIESVEDVDAVYELASTVREVVGRTMDIGVDLHGRISPALAPRLVAKLESLDLMFIEELVRPEFQFQLGRIDQHVTTPIAYGERLYSRWDFRPYFEAGSIDVAQPDITHAGGITETKKIADLAAMYGVALAINCPHGPVAYAAASHVNTVASNAVIQYSGESQYTKQYVEHPADFQQEDGYISPPDKPGLGVKLDEETVREQSMTSPDWRHPIRRHDDSSVAEW